MDKISPFLWFDDQAEEAANFYVSLFPDSKIVNVSHYGDEPPGRKGQVMVVDFRLAGQRFMALNGGPEFTFNESMSLYVECEDQDEVDTLWSKLTADGGEESMCGWLKDRWGVSWQIIPKQLVELIGDPDPERARRATHAMLQMRKIEIAELERAADGK